MTQWHADIDTASLSPGARVTVLSQHHVVRVMTADTLSIETPVGHRFSAQVLDRTQGAIRLVLDDGTPFALQIEVDESLTPPGTNPSVFHVRSGWRTRFGIERDVQAKVHQYPPVRSSFALQAPEVAFTAVEITFGVLLHEKDRRMTPERLSECLRLVRWQKQVLAEALDVPATLVTGWLAGTEQIPRKVGAWVEALCFVHEAAEETIPSTAGEGYGDGPHREFIPVYAYNLLRNLNQAPVLLKSLFGSDDEGAVFFLVSRGLAAREGDHLMITDGGRGIGAMTT